MKRLVLTITLASLAALTPVGAPAPRARACPTLSVSCTDAGMPGAPATFTVNIGDAPDDARLTFHWVVSAGTISSGQGTTSITVDTTGIPRGLTAAVDVKGLPESCPDSASCGTSVHWHEGFDDRVDEYGNLRWGDERARLDNYIVELRNYPMARACMICYGGRRARAGEARRRCARAADYLKRVGGIDAARIVTLDGGFREEPTVELWRPPAGAVLPSAAATVDPSEVIIVKDAPARKRPRSRPRSR
ncbi:MAG TPA: hypothetical protein VF570_09345 [Pyrinomonadaceae bacterium]